MAADIVDGADPAVDVDVLTAAARGAIAPLGQARWFARPLVDGIELRSVVKDWVEAPVDAAREMRAACGAALCAARLTLLAHGRQPMVAHPRRPGLVATLRAGGHRDPRRDELVLHRALRGAPPGGRPVHGDALRGALRRASDARHVWFRTVADPGPAALAGWARPWRGGGTDDVGAGGVLAVLAAPATDRIADLRVGDTAQLLTLLAATLGWDVHVLSGPMPRDRARQWAGADAASGSVLLLRATANGSPGAG